jgi:hypothetical protein
MFRVQGHKILFRFTKNGRWLIVYKNELPALIINLAFSILSVLILCNDFKGSWNYALFFPTLLIAYIFIIYYRRKPHFKNVLKQAEWDKIFKDSAPFTYNEDGFSIEMETLGLENVPWTEISKIVALRHEKFDVDTIELIVEVGNKFSFSVAEFSYGSVQFFDAIKKELVLKDAYWFGTIARGANNLLVYEKE